MSAETIARIPPHNLDAERAVLGAILIEGREGQAIARGAALLRPDNFYTDGHRRIFTHMLRLHEAERGVDLITLSESLRAAGELEPVGGPAALALLVEHASIATHLDDYIRIVLTHWGERRKIEVYTQEIQHAFNGGSNTIDVAEELARIAERADPQAAAQLAARAIKPVHVREVLTGIMDSLDQPETDLVPTPVPELTDRLAGGLLRGEFALLGGRPGTAKTALAVQWAALAAQLGHKTLVVSREMMNAALGRRLLAQQAHVSATALRRRKLTDAETLRVVRALPRLSALPLWFDDQAATLGQIRRLVRAGGYRFVVVDYLQLVRSPADARNRRLEVTAISAGLKTLAKQSQCTVLTLSALRRLQVEGGGRGRKGKRLAPVLEDLKESGDIEADADVVVLLHQPRPDSSDRELIFAKLREGETGGSVTLAFTPMYVRFTEVPMALPGAGREPGDEVPF